MIKNPNNLIIVKVIKMILIIIAITTKTTTTIVITILIIIIIIIIIIIKELIPTLAVANIVHRSNPGCWTSVLVTLIGRLCGTDPYNFTQEHVISIEKVSC